MSKNSDQIQTAPRKFKLGPLGSLNQVTKGLAKTIRAMADGTLDSQVGARICNGLGIMRACLETQKLEQLESRMDEIADRVARDRTNAARERTSIHEAQRLSH
jgi:glutamate synthase domain-containing protein 2